MPWAVRAAKMTLEQIHEHRQEFVKEVKKEVADSLALDGLELESVSLTSLDQTDIKLFDPSNTFDAEGLTRLTEQIEARKKKRNDIEKDTMIAIRTKNLEAEKRSLEIARDSEYARLDHEAEVAIQRAQQPQGGRDRRRGARARNRGREDPGTRGRRTHPHRDGEATRAAGDQAPRGAATGGAGSARSPSP